MAYARYMAEFGILMREMEANMNERSFQVACEFIADLAIKKGKLTLQPPPIATQED